MSSIRVDMTMSLDGYVTGPDDGPDAPMGTGGFRLFNWLDKRNGPGPSAEVFAETLARRRRPGPGLPIVMPGRAGPGRGRESRCRAELRARSRRAGSVRVRSALQR
jgi:hypothetical protein